jgi:hypothetical protein
MVGVFLDVGAQRLLVVVVFLALYDDLDIECTLANTQIRIR